MKTQIIVILITLASCAGKQLKTHSIYWDRENKSVMRYKMQVTAEEIADGNCFHYYENGQLLSKVRYEDNRLMEINEVYDSLGNKLPYGNFKDGNGYVIV